MTSFVCLFTFCPFMCLPLQQGYSTGSPWAKCEPFHFGPQYPFKYTVSTEKYGECGPRKQIYKISMALCGPQAKLVENPCLTNKNLATHTLLPKCFSEITYNHLCQIQ